MKAILEEIVINYSIMTHLKEIKMKIKKEMIQIQKKVLLIFPKIILIIVMIDQVSKVIHILTTIMI